jgi:cytochrome c2
MYDPSSFTTRRRRAAHLKDYEYFCKEHLQLNTHAEMWDMNTIIDTQKKYIAGSAMMAKGIINEKVKGMLLYIVPTICI